jgi:cytoskeletal protein CcmA (bactofilin family)
MANEFIIKNGFHSKGDSQITGSLSITGISDVSASIAAAGGSTPTLQQVITAGAQANGDVVITGSLVISGSFDAFKLETDNIILGPNANNIQAGADNSVIIGHANVQSAYSGEEMLL